MTAMLAAPPPLTAEQYARLPDDGVKSELVKGRIVRMTPPFTYHGYVCNRIQRFLDQFIEAHGLGRLFTNDAGVLTERSPDTVRGADAAYYSFARLPPGPLPREGYYTAPDLAVEVRSPSDRWPDVLEKVSEYLKAGVAVVVVLDPRTNSAFVYRADHEPQTFGPDDTLTLPDVLPGFELVVRRVFE